MTVDRAEAHRRLDALLDEASGDETEGDASADFTFDAFNELIAEIAAPIRCHLQAKWQQNHDEAVGVGAAKDEAIRLANLQTIVLVLAGVEPLLPAGKAIAQLAANDILVALPAGDEPYLFKRKVRTGKRSPARSQQSRVAQKRITSALHFQMGFSGSDKSKALRDLKLSGDEDSHLRQVWHWVRNQEKNGRFAVARGAGEKHSRGQQLSEEERDALDAWSAVKQATHHALFTVASGGEP